MTSPRLPSADCVAAVRRFNRFYTRQLGLLQAHYLASGFSLAEARVLYEIGQRDNVIARDIAASLDLDLGYLSRMVRGLSRRRLVARTRSKSDGRQVHLALTQKGRSTVALLDRRSSEEVGKLLSPLADAQQARLVNAMQVIEQILGGVPSVAPSFALRPHRPGDMGWVVSRHGALYGQEYGWGPEIEALTAEIVARFIRQFDPQRERCWIAEVDGERVGSVFLVRESEGVARLRLLLVEPRARGLGIGRRLVEECIAFARAAGYDRITLWTHSVLTAARRIYERAGFYLVKTWTHSDFGKEETGETWELPLR